MPEKLLATESRDLFHEIRQRVATAAICKPVTMQRQDDPDFCPELFFPADCRGPNPRRWRIQTKSCTHEDPTTCPNRRSVCPVLLSEAVGKSECSITRTGGLTAEGIRIHGWFRGGTR